MEHNRRTPRSHLFMKAVLEVGGRQLDVRLRNLSSDGALVEGTDLPVEGTEILFRKEKLSVPGRIAWTADGRAGVSFAQDLQPEVVLRHVPQPRSRMEVSSRRPGLTSSQLSEGEKRYVDEWLLPRS